MTNFTLVAFTCVLSLFASCVDNRLSVDIPATPEPVHSQVPECGKLREEISNFDQDDDGTRKRAEVAVLDIAKGSQLCRDLAVKLLIDTVNDQKEPIIREQKALNRWDTTVDALGRLGGSEAVEPLAQHLTVNEGAYGLGLGVFPAALALARLGDVSLPSLVSIACNSKSDTNVEQAVGAIYAIHTPAALAALDAVRTKGSNQWVRQHAAELISQFKHSPKSILLDTDVYGSGFPGPPPIPKLPPPKH